MMSPVFSRIMSVKPLSFSESQYSAVLRSCQTMALWTGTPVSASQTIVVSLWLVIPIAAMSSFPNLRAETASCATPIWLDQISIGSCSTQPGLGKCWVNSFWATDTALPARSKTIALELVVPWSRASMYLSIYLLVQCYSTMVPNKVAEVQSPILTWT